MQGKNGRKSKNGWNCLLYHKNNTVTAIYMLISIATVAGASNFPDIEIVGCPVTYDSQTEMYLVDFQFRTPFSAAALSHIRHFAIHVDSLQRLEQGPNDYTLVGRRMPIDDNIPVNNNLFLH